MTFEQIMSDIRSRKFSNLYFLCGEESYFIDQISDALQLTILNEAEKEFNQTVLYGLDTNVLTVISEAKRYPMMSPYNVVMVREAQHLKDIEDLESYVEKPVPSTILVICYKDKKLDKRKTFAKVVAKNGVYLETKKLYENKVPEWIMKELSKSGYHISERNATLITEFLGNDLGNISNELSKLILNLPAGSTVNGEEIEQYIGINKDYNTFELNAAIGHRNIVKANRIINHFGQNEKKYPIQLVIASLYGYLTKVIKFHYVQNRPRGEQASFIGVGPFFVNEYDLAAKHYSMSKLADMIGVLKTYDLKSKGVDSGSAGHGELMKEMVYKLLH